MNKTMMAGLAGLFLLSFQVKEIPAAQVQSPVEKLQQRMAELTTQFDVNQDGTLSPDESAALEAFLANPANKEEALLKQIKRFDADGNWKLDEQETAAAAKEFMHSGEKTDSAKKAGSVKKAETKTVKEKPKTPDYNIPDPNFMKPVKAVKSGGKIKRVSK